MITIVNYGGANISSIQFAFERLGVQTQVSLDAEQIVKSSHIILPGVASAESAMRCLHENNLRNILVSLTQPVLGICLGMQLLFDFSEEGNVECLKIIPGKIKKIPIKETLSVPHMGWNTLEITKNNALLQQVKSGSYVYFVHSFFSPFSELTVAITEYVETFSSVVQYKNFFGTQFHPERSGDVGQQILKNFLRL